MFNFNNVEFYLQKLHETQTLILTDWDNIITTGGSNTIFLFYKHWYRSINQAENNRICFDTHPDMSSIYTNKETKKSFLYWLFCHHEHGYIEWIFNSKKICKQNMKAFLGKLCGLHNAHFLSEQAFPLCKQFIFLYVFFIVENISK